MKSKVFASIDINHPPERVSGYRMSINRNNRIKCGPLRRLLAGLLSMLLVAASFAMPALAADPAIPNFWDAKERLKKPDLSELRRLRFLTTLDFPPFNFLDSDGELTGFNVDLARAVCTDLGILDKCQ